MGTGLLGRRVLLLIASVAATALLTPGAARAQSGGTVVLPTINVVSATTVPTPAGHLGSSVSVITGKDIAREQIRTVAGALRQVPGLNVVQTGGPGGQTSVFLRGTNANHVKVLIDGIDIGDPTTPNGAVDFGHLLAGDIERIEVLRGPQSGLYGSDAIGGVISITTKKGEGAPKAHASVEGGSLGTFNQTAGLRGARGRFNYAFNIAHYRSTDVPVTPLRLLAAGEKRNNDNYDNWTYSANVGADLSEDLAVNLVARYTDAKLGFTGEDFSNYPNNYPEALQSTQVNHNLYTRAEAVWSAFNGRFKNYFGINYSRLWNWSFNPNADFAANNGFTSPLVGPPVTNLGVRTNYNWRGVVHIMHGQTLVLGVEREHDSLRTDSTGTVDGSFNYTQTTTRANTGNTAGYIELQSEIADRFFLAANVRHDEHDAFGGHTTWRVAPAVILPVTDTKLKASYGTGFKAPTLTELYVNNPSYSSVANPNLAPEESRGYDIGFEQPFWGRRGLFGVTYFHNDITNLINNQYDASRKVFTYVNVGEAKTHGVESFASLRVGAQWRLRAEYTRLITRDESTGLGLRNRPGHKESFSAIWTPTAGVTLTATVLHVGRAVEFNRDGTIARVNSDPYTLVNVAADYKVDPHVTLFGRVNNLLDRHYESPVGFDQPGLAVYGGIRVSN